MKFPKIGGTINTKGRHTKEATTTQCHSGPSSTRYWGILYTVTSGSTSTRTRYSIQSILISTQVVLRIPACSHCPRDGQPAGHQMDVILLDFSKAFNKVPHRPLLHKLDYCEIRENTFHWIKWFLVNITQEVLLEEMRPTTFRFPFVH